MYQENGIGAESFYEKDSVSYFVSVSFFVKLLILPTVVIFCETLFMVL